MAEAEAFPARDDFKIAIICALPLEGEAVKRLFDVSWKPGKASHTLDHNTYTAGYICNTLVVLVWMSDYGKTKAAMAASHLRFSFKNIDSVLVVGICGGVPKTPKGDDVVLGDVVISTQLHKYDEGKRYPGEFLPSGTARKPHKWMRAFLNRLQGESQTELKRSCAAALERLFACEKLYAFPGAMEDMLYKPDYIHKHRNPTQCFACIKPGGTCEDSRKKSCAAMQCSTDASMIEHRLSRNPKEPSIHFGIIGSGDTVMKSGSDRDAIAKRDQIVGFEMEGAGVCEEFETTVVIKGVCDYADSHKNKKWQDHAAAVAAAFTWVFLKELREEQFGTTPVTSRQNSYSSVSTHSSATSTSRQNSYSSVPAFDPTTTSALPSPRIPVIRSSSDIEISHSPTWSSRSSKDYTDVRRFPGPFRVSPMPTAEVSEEHTEVQRGSLGAAHAWLSTLFLSEESTCEETPALIQKETAEEIARLLLETQHDKEPLAAAARLLQRPDIDVNVLGDKGKRALHIVLGTANVSRNKQKMDSIARLTAMLCERHADPSAPDDAGRTPLHQCVKTSNIEAMRVLLKHGANVNMGDERKRTPTFMLGFEKNPNPAMAEMLERANAHLNGLKLPPLPGRPNEAQRRVRAILERCIDRR